MSLTKPNKLTLPFASSGNKNVIPLASQIGITGGAASYTDGFPPLTMTPVSAGGIPPSGKDMNGIIYTISDIVCWLNAGGGFEYDSVFANDTNIDGYSLGAKVKRTDGLGYWLNTIAGNKVDPETSGAVAAGWVPDFTTGISTVALSSSNVTLTPLQYGKPIIALIGTLTASINLIFPAIPGQWTILNNTTGAFTVTCKTASGVGVIANSGPTLITNDGLNFTSNSIPNSTTLVAGIIQLATNVESQTGTNATKALSPASMKAGLNASGNAPTFACRAWANYSESSGGGSLKNSGNVSSITRNNLGDYTINFTTALPTADYAVTLSCTSWTLGNFAIACIHAPSAGAPPTLKTTTQLRIQTYVNQTTTGDLGDVSVCIFC